MTSESPVLQTDPAARAGSAPGKLSFTVAAPVVMLQEPNSAQAESIRALRTHIMAQHVQEGRRALAVCAATAGVGCTFTATNLAVALSQIGVQTLLIDADLRKGGVNGLIRPSVPVEGLRQSLESGESTFGDYIQHEVLPNLSIMYSGGVAPNAQELLGQAEGRGLAHPASGNLLLANMDQAIEERAGGEHHGPRPDLTAIRQPET